LLNRRGKKIILNKGSNIMNREKFQDKKLEIMIKYKIILKALIIKISLI